VSRQEEHIEKLLPPIKTAFCISSRPPLIKIPAPDHQKRSCTTLRSLRHKKQRRPVKIAADAQDNGQK
jgi:hypothetical protein